MKYEDFIKSRHQICINANKKLLCQMKKNPIDLRKLCEFSKRVACKHPKFDISAGDHDDMTF